MKTHKPLRYRVLQNGLIWGWEVRSAANAVLAQGLSRTRVDARATALLATIEFGSKRVAGKLAS
jgi:hypothetical protein